MVQWFGLCASTVGGPGLISGWGTKVSQAGQHEPKKNKKTKKQNIFQMRFLRYS